MDIYEQEQTTDEFCILTNLPPELLLVVFSFLDVNSLCNISLVCRTWKSITDYQEYWKEFYKNKYLTTEIVQVIPVRTWKQLLFDRQWTEANYTQTTTITVTGGRSGEFSLYGEMLRKRATDISLSPSPEELKQLILPGLPPSSYYSEKTIEVHTFIQQIACESFASALVLNSENKDASFNYGYVLCQVAKFKDLPEASLLFYKSFDLYKKAAVKGYILQENVLRYWADGLADLAKKVDDNEAEKLLIEACSKYSESIGVNPNYFMGYYYYGVALRSLAKLTSSTNKPDAEMYFAKACNILEQANMLRTEDTFVLCELATTLHDYAQLKEGSEAEDLFSKASARYSDAHNLMPTDAYVVRCWADSAYDHAKCIYARILDKIEDENHLAQVENLLKEACSRYEVAVNLNPKYSNAYNSYGLALSTLAKVCEDFDVAEMLFSQAFQKLDLAMTSRTGNTNIELCNYSMTLVAQGIKREKFKLPSDQVKPLIKEAKQRLKPLIDTNDPWSYFCLSRLYAAVRKEDKCKKYLELCNDKGYLQKASKWQLLYFDNVKHCNWFIALVKDNKNFK